MQRWSISVNHRTSFFIYIGEQIHEVSWGCLFSERTPKLKCSIYAWVPLIILCSTIRYRIKWGSSLHRLLFSAFLRNNPTAFSSNMKCTVCINIACRRYDSKNIHALIKSWFSATSSYLCSQESTDHQQMGQIVKFGRTLSQIGVSRFDPKVSNMCFVLAS